MSRRSRKASKQSSKNLVPIIIGVVIALVAVAAIVIIPKVISPENFNAKPLDHRRYMKNASSMVGNKYKVVGVIRERESLPGSGDTRLSVEPEDATDGELLGIFINKEVRNTLDDLNLELQNKYVFFVEVTPNSFLEAFTVKSQ